MKVFLSYLVHLFTTSGVLLSFFALVASIEQNLELVFFYLAFALFVDGIDGSLARMVDVKKHTPHINGENLDNIIDYLNYVFVPVFVIYWLDFVPADLGIFRAHEPWTIWEVWSPQIMPWAVWGSQANRLWDVWGP